MSELLQAMLSRGDTREDAEETISIMQGDVLAGASPEDVLYEDGLEPDYIFDLI